MLGLSGRIVVPGYVRMQVTIIIVDHRLAIMTGHKPGIVIKVSVGAGGTGVPKTNGSCWHNGASDIRAITDTRRESSGGRGGPLRGNTRQDGEASSELKENVREKKGKEPGA